jgi:hypothetical protein
VTAFEGEVVHANDFWRARVKQCCRVDRVQHCRTTSVQTEFGGGARSSSTAEFDAEVAQGSALPFGAVSIAFWIIESLAEDASRAAGIATTEAPNVKLERNGLTADGQIRDGADVMAVDV